MRVPIFTGQNFGYFFVVNRKNGGGRARKERRCEVASSHELNFPLSDLRGALPGLLWSAVACLKLEQVPLCSRYNTSKARAANNAGRGFLIIQETMRAM